jgi:hypothetical protein
VVAEVVVVWVAAAATWVAVWVAALVVVAWAAVWAADKWVPD